ncbi:hypothetical protein [Vagococcus fluvialis]|uniref:hypothetical protein n=1 Tax=Vagococcus fluvialis TaxID=2738 RepID=UPI003B212509
MSKEIQITEQVEGTTEKAFFRGKELELNYSVWSLVQLQEVHQIKIDELAESGEMDFSTLVKIVWAGLQDEYEDATFKEVAQSIGIGEIQAVSAELNRAMSVSDALGK